ncbi:MAG: J domain-containing protein [Proteobacteria bacterium]|nr:J domain-containing protein [Pseudomonadota bacterium]
MNEYISILDKKFRNEDEIKNELSATIERISEKKKLAYNNKWITNQAIKNRVSYDDICIEIDNELNLLKKYVIAFRKYLEKEQIIVCTNCRQKIRVKEFNIEVKVTCPKCDSILRLLKGALGSIKVTLIEEKEKRSSNSESHDTDFSIENSFKILGILPTSSFEEIRKAYRVHIAKYHPDKVSHLGEEFRNLAEHKTKEINIAFSFLKSNYE